MAGNTRRRTPLGEPKYKRLTEKERIIIETLRKEGRSRRHIARGLGCSPSTVSRELKRNTSGKGYRHGKAQEMAEGRMRTKSSRRRKFTEEMWVAAKAKLEEGCTFEQIAGRRTRRAGSSA